MACYIIAGSTSNLATTVLLRLLLSQHAGQIYATHNTGNDIASNVNYIDREAGLRMARNKELRCALWLAPTDDTVAVAEFAREVPTLVISSMSIAENMTKGGDPAKLNPYQTGKLAMFNVPGVYSIAPGFFIDDDLDDEEVISAGLHGDTTRELTRPLGIPFLNAKFTYKKPPMSVTLKSKLASVIAAWVANPTGGVIKPNTFTVLCTDGEYDRKDLRLMALGDNVPVPIPDLYSALPHPIVDGVPIRIEHYDVGKAINHQYFKKQKTE